MAGKMSGVVPNAGHTQGLATEPRAWETRVIGFLSTALNVGSGSQG